MEGRERWSSKVPCFVLFFHPKKGVYIRISLRKMSP